MAAQKPEVQLRSAGGIQYELYRKKIKQLHLRVRDNGTVMVSIPLRTMARRMVDATGLSPNNYLGRVRLCHAMRLLAKSNDSVTDIAFACGFNDSNYFSSRFHQEIGVTPMQFRKQKAGYAHA